MNRIIFATGNAGKMKEIREILGDMDAEILSMKEAGIKADIVEDGTTFEENAKIKAQTVAQFTKDIVLADDSGLEVDYLNKEPGVYSARYMGENTSYTIKNQAILDRLRVCRRKNVQHGLSALLRLQCQMEMCLLREKRLKDISEKSRQEVMGLDMIRFFTWTSSGVLRQNLRKNRKIRSVTGVRHCVP